MPAELARPDIDPASGDRDRKRAWRAQPIRARTMAAILACALSATACAAGTAAPHQPTAHQAAPTSVALPQVPASGREHVPSALYGTVVYGPAGAGLPRPLVNPADIIPGGPPPDGIPAIDHPRFLRPAQVSFLSADEPVLALQIGADARAYPVQILIWHEIVNDTVGGVPVTITYCPLCNTAIAYDRRAAGRVLSFGTSGLLYDSNLLMYDRQTRRCGCSSPARRSPACSSGISCAPTRCRRCPGARGGPATRTAGCCPGIPATPGLTASTLTPGMTTSTPRRFCSPAR